jgi:GTP diphosphokinase / guanosine-3',5'-bis(diphosphate) 3'-diphosphatase
MIRLNDITSQILSYYPNSDIGLIEKAYVYSAKVHQGQIRLSGEPYLSHPLEAAFILSQMKMDVVCIAAGLLHDTIEDTNAELDEIRRLFGNEVASIVDGVTKIGKLTFTSQKERQAENMRKMILAMSSDIRVILVKLADRLHNMRTLGYQSPEKQRRIARETLDIYAPLSSRMGIYWIKSSLEDLCLYYLEPDVYHMIKTGIAERRGEREKFVKEVKAIISTKLAEVGIENTIKGRYKHFYSIYKKMCHQDLKVDEVFDIIAFRVIVNSVTSCYEALGHIHSMWKPVPGRFKDYISVPKANMYQSLHTTVVGPYGERMEIQIRSWEMDRVAEEGIAAHWKYKEGHIPSSTDEKQFMWLRQILELQTTLKDPEEFLDTIRMNLFPDEVYVFTPTGEVKEFPRGATPVDFAYSIHSEVGEKCVGAKVNDRMVSLRYQLQNGDIVTIITSPKQHPSKDWLEFVKTPRARTKIRQWLRNQEREQSINIGKSILDKALEQEQIDISSQVRAEHLAAVAKEMSFQAADDLYAQIGFGKTSARQVIGKLKPRLGIRDEKHAGLVSKVVGHLKRKKSDQGIKVKGVSDMLIRFANCCNPLPGEKVIGFLTRGRGVTIHNRDCKHILHANPDRLVEVSWETGQQDSYAAKLKVTGLDKKGLLADISTVLTQKDANILQADIRTTTDHKAVLIFSMAVADYEHLQDIMGAINRIRNVLMVERL